VATVNSRALTQRYEGERSPRGEGIRRKAPSPRGEPLTPPDRSWRHVAVGLEHLPQETWLYALHEPGNRSDGIRTP
jgi:hypothetical protein